jgi:HK97 family phage prohead protease
MTDFDFDERRVFHLDTLEARAVDDDSGRRLITGLAAPYNVETPIGGVYLEVLAPGVFKRSIKNMAASGKAMPLHMFHDTKTWPVGKAVGWEDTERGLVGTWEIIPEGVDEVADKAYRMAQDDFINGLSVGFQPIRSDIDPGTDTRPPRVTRLEARMFETSMVSAPAYAGAQITLVRTAGLKVNRPHLDRWRDWAGENL